MKFRGGGEGLKRLNVDRKVHLEVRFIVRIKHLCSSAALHRLMGWGWFINSMWWLDLGRKSERLRLGQPSGKAFQDVPGYQVCRYVDEMLASKNSRLRCYKLFHPRFYLYRLIFLGSSCRAATQIRILWMITPD